MGASRPPRIMQVHSSLNHSYTTLPPGANQSTFPVGEGRKGREDEQVLNFPIPTVIHASCSYRVVLGLNQNPTQSILQYNQRLGIMLQHDLP